jgi:signal transduction histidine kinase
MKRGILRLSIGAYLIAFNAVLAGLVLAILVAEIGYDRARTINEFVREIDNVSDVLSGHMRESFGVIDQALLGMAEILATENMDDPTNARFFFQRLVERQRLTFGTYAYYLLDPDGRLRYVSSTPKAEPVDFSPLPSFQVHRENSPGLYIGAPTHGTYGDAAGKWVVHVTRRISRADGRFAGVVGAILSLDDLRQGLSQLNVGPDGAIGVFRADGILLTRHPVREEVIGRSYQSSPLFSEHVAQRPNGMAPMRYYSDGVMRYTSYRTVEARPLVVSVAASEQDMLSAWRERTLVAVATALFLIALLGAATVVAHRVLRRRESEQRANSARLSKLAEAAAELASISDLDSLLRRSTETARALIGCHQAMTTVTEGGRARHTLSVSEKYAAWDRPDGDTGDVYGFVFERNQPVRLTQAELENHPVWRDLRGGSENSPPLRGWLSVPLFGQDGSVLGRIRLSDRDAGDFTEDDEAILVQIANVTSAAIENIRMAARERESAVQLRQAQKMESLGQLTGGVAHDFNNLLTVILGNADLLVEELDGTTPRQRTNAEMIQRAAERAADLTKRLLAFSRRQVLQPAEIDANALLTGMEGLLRRSLGAHVEVRFSLAADLWLTLADPSQTEIAILNLAINARDAMPDGGLLTISTANVQIDLPAGPEGEAVSGPYVMISVRDAGTGMPPEVLARAVEPFFTTKEAGKGSGLGLSMVYGFAQQSAGHMRIESQPGRGTTVRLYLPQAVGTTATIASVVAPGEMPRGSERILLVEDDPLVRGYIEGTLRDLGYTVVGTGAGREALEKLDAGLAFDILVTDVILPGGMSGPMIAAEVRKRRAGIKVLYISGYTGDAMQNDGRVAPDSVFLGKPFRQEDLARKLREALAA